MADPLIGKTLGGCEILSVIGQGGMGVIYRARQKSLDRIVAMKVLSPRLASDEAFVARFQREARAIARISHPNILAVYDVGEQDGIHFIVMELIDGCSLAELQAQRKILPAPEAAEYIRQAALGLAAAQEAGIIHRDIKPENLLITRNKIVKVSDFGLAKEADGSQTSTEAVMGTPAFMSPEQCDGKRVDGRSDIYSLGGTFYKLITGRLPFEAETAMSMMYRHKHEPLVPPIEVVPSVPQAISDLIVRMMAKKREHRPQTMEEVAQALEACLKMLRLPEEEIAPSDKARPAVPRPEIRAGTARFVHRPPPAGGEQAASPRYPGTEVVQPPRQAPSSRRFEAAPATEGGRFPADGVRFDAAMATGRFGPPPGAPDTEVLMPPRPGAVARGEEPPRPPDEAHAQIIRGEEMLARGDKVGGLKCFRAVLASPGLDQATREKLETLISEEVGVRRRAAEGLAQRGMLVEAAKELRIVVDLDPADEEVRARLRDIDRKLQARRALANDIRTLISGGRFQEAVDLYDKASPDVRDEAVATQIEHLRRVRIPVDKLCSDAEKLSDAGALEEARELFERALKLDENCERARQGVKDVERKFATIERLLREGYDLAQRHDYARAIEVWSPILEIRPGHTQTVKQIVDARIAYSRNLKEQGDLPGAVAQLQAAAALEPSNRSLAGMLEEARNLADTEAALVEKAGEAARKRRLGRAAGFWKRVLAINPSNKKAAANLAALNRARFLYWVKALSSLALIGVCGGLAYLFFDEKDRLGRASAALEGGSPETAIGILGRRPVFLFREKAAKLLLAASLMDMWDTGEKLLKEDHLVEAAAAFEKGERMAEDREQRRRFAVGAINARVLARKKAAAELEGKGEWRKAREEYAAAQELLASPDAREELRNLQEEIRTAIRFVSLVEQGEESLRQGNKVRAAERFAEAATIRQGHPLAVERMRALEAEAEAFRKALAEAGGLLASRGDSAAVNAAIARLDDALQRNPDDVSAALMKQYALDLKTCLDSGMALVAETNPLKSKLWGAEQRKRAFCVDRYEYPNRAGEVPMTNISWLEAKNLCAIQDKVLCAKRDWADACKGEGFNMPYPYGLTFDPEACNASGGKVEESGSRKRCVNSFGLYDMSGNVAEWVDEVFEGEAEAAGGHYSSGADDSRCESFRRLKRDGRFPEIGFRCCRRLVK
ncbi:MAG: protein kinase [Planctomycetota bacterium]|nr:protein kinase [Planctomycetota bacterium]